ncbi:MAG: carboxylating nicotinate-nucleotide diphosphorylase [Candidatus Omnitrophota bacterium]
MDEDIGASDITTKALFPKPRTAQAVILSGGEGILAGITVAMSAFVMRDSKVKFMPLEMDGRRIYPERQVAYIEGDIGAILSAERTALNLMSRLSGIATLASRFVEAVKPYKTKILDTRKTTPGLRTLEKYAVATGGGTNHRIGLYDQMLIKDNHLAALGYDWGKVASAVSSARKKRIRTEIEVQDIAQFRKALEICPDVIMLDNMGIRHVKEAVALRDNGHFELLLEVSGGVNLRNVRKYAAAGVDMISIGALTHSAQALDFSLEMVR